MISTCLRLARVEVSNISLLLLSHVVTCDVGISSGSTVVVVVVICWVRNLNENYTAENEWVRKDSWKKRKSRNTSVLICQPRLECV